MASKKKNPYDAFDSLVDALDTAYNNKNGGCSFDDAIAELAAAFDAVMGFLPEPD